jgi:hypothetical protein
VAANLVGNRIGRRAGGPRGARNARLITGGATMMVSAGQQRSAEVQLDSLFPHASQPMCT